MDGLGWSNVAKLADLWPKKYKRFILGNANFLIPLSRECISLDQLSVHEFKLLIMIEQSRGKLSQHWMPTLNGRANACTLLCYLYCTTTWYNFCPPAHLEPFTTKIHQTYALQSIFSFITGQKRDAARVLTHTPISEALVPIYDSMDSSHSINRPGTNRTRGFGISLAWGGGR